jgi:acid stress-induced BolA-like protein IbaG/YrbA
MEAILMRVQKALQKKFSHKGIHVESVGVDSKKVGGWIISKSFEGLDGMQRQKKVWNLFEKFLDEKDRARLGIFLTFTPLEKKMAFDDDFDRLDRPLKRKASSPKKKATTAGRKKVGASKRATLPT